MEASCKSSTTKLRVLISAPDGRTDRQGCAARRADRRTDSRALPKLGLSSFPPPERRNRARNKREKKRLVVAVSLAFTVFELQLQLQLLLLLPPLNVVVEVEPNPIGFSFRDAI